MAKKQKKQAIPKRVAGVKIPKAVRSGLSDFIRSQSGKALASEAVGAVVAAVAASQLKRDSLARTQLSQADFTGAATSSSTAIKNAVGEAIRTFKDSLHREKLQADARAAWPEGGDADASSKKKRSPPLPQSPH